MIEKGVPIWLRRREADADALSEIAQTDRTGPETSAKQVFDRLAGTWTYWGWKGGYFSEERDALAGEGREQVEAELDVARAVGPLWEKFRELGG